MSAVFNTVSKLSRGYDLEEVDDFFANARAAYDDRTVNFGANQVRSATFRLVRGGYAVAEVDQALDRMEIAFFSRERTEFIELQGKKAWFEATSATAKTLYGRLLRPAGGRFDRPPAGQQGYRASEVDAVLDRLTGYFNQGEALTSHELRTTLFRSARGKRAYNEAQVDAFIRRAVEVLLAVE